MTVRFRRAPIRWSLLPLVMAGGALGVATRALLTAGAADPIEALPVIIAVNAAGSGLLGLLVGWAGSRPRLRAFLGTGVLGGFTSFSALAPALALGATGAVTDVAQGGVAAAARVLLLALAWSLPLLVLPVGIAAAGYVLGSRAARRAA